MSEPTGSSDTGASPGPFLGALVIIVLVVGAIWLLNVFDSDDLSADQLIGRAVAGQNDALQRQDYPTFRTFMCAEQQGVEPEIIDEQRVSSDKRGERFVEKVGVVRVDGDRATAEVTYYFDKDREAKETVEIPFVREDGAWKVCSTGPR